MLGFHHLNTTSSEFAYYIDRTISMSLAIAVKEVAIQYIRLSFKLNCTASSSTFSPLENTLVFPSNLSQNG